MDPGRPGHGDAGGGGNGPFGGLGWMLAGHAVNRMSSTDAADVRAYAFMANLGGWLTFAAVMTTTLLLSETSIDYLHFMFGGEPETWLVGLITGAAAVVVLVGFGLVYVPDPDPACRVRRRRRAHEAVVAVDQGGHGGIVSLAVVASWLATTLARFPKDWLTTPNTGLVFAVIMLTFVVPAIIATAICYSVPGPENRQPAISE